MWWTIKNEFIVAAYLHAVTHFQIYSVANKYIAVVHTQLWRQFHLFGSEKYYKILKIITNLLTSKHAALLEQQGRTERHSKFRTGPRQSFGCQEIY